MNGPPETTETPRTGKYKMCHGASATVEVSTTVAKSATISGRPCTQSRMPRSGPLLGFCTVITARTPWVDPACSGTKKTRCMACAAASSLACTCRPVWRSRASTNSRTNPTRHPTRHKSAGPIPRPWHELDHRSLAPYPIAKVVFPPKTARENANFHDPDTRSKCNAQHKYQIGLSCAYIQDVPPALRLPKAIREVLPKMRALGVQICVPHRILCQRCETLRHTG